MGQAKTHEATEGRKSASNERRKVQAVLDSKQRTTDVSDKKGMSATRVGTGTQSLANQDETVEAGRKR